MSPSVHEIIELAELLESPEPTSSVEAFTAVPIPNLSGCHIGVSGDKNLTFLIESMEKQALRERVELKGIVTRFSELCDIKSPHGQKNRGVFTIVECRTDDASEQELFVRVLLSFAEMLDAHAERPPIYPLLKQLIELFHALDGPATATIQGLWSELFLIAECSDRALFISSWHHSPRELWDFSCGTQHLEVKSTSSNERIHHFSLAQLSPPSDHQVIVASLTVKRAGDGKSIGELLDVLRSDTSLPAGLMFTTEQVVAISLGKTWRTAITDRYSVSAAQDSLQYYSAGDIPGIEVSGVPAEVSDVRFKSNLTSVKSLEQKVRRSLGGLFATAPRG